MEYGPCIMLVVQIGNLQPSKLVRGIKSKKNARLVGNISQLGVKCTIYVNNTFSCGTWSLPLVCCIILFCIPHIRVLVLILHSETRNWMVTLTCIFRLELNSVWLYSQWKIKWCSTLSVVVVEMNNVMFVAGDYTSPLSSCASLVLLWGKLFNYYYTILTVTPNQIKLWYTLTFKENLANTIWIGCKGVKRNLS
jgi:hypothetical protein